MLSTFLKGQQRANDLCTYTEKAPEIYEQWEEQYGINIQPYNRFI